MTCVALQRKTDFRRSADSSKEVLRIVWHTTSRPTIGEKTTALLTIESGGPIRQLTRTCREATTSGEISLDRVRRATAITESHPGGPRVDHEGDAVVVFGDPADRRRGRILRSGQ